ncbi:DUF4083 family protein [Bacillus sp. JJ664]
MVNIGDIIYQLVVLLVLIFFIIFIVSFVRNFKKRNNQLKRIEDKLDKLSELKSKRVD